MKKIGINSKITKAAMAFMICCGTASYGQNVIHTICGTGVTGSNGDSGPATAAQIMIDNGIYVDNAMNVYLGGTENKVRKINGATGIITTIAGTGTAAYSGDGGPATAAEINSSCGLTMAPDGNIYFSDVMNRRIRKINTTTGIITTVAGGGTGGLIEGGPATAESTLLPTAVKFDNLGNMYIADCGGGRIRKVNSMGIITTFAGNGSFASYGDGGPATAAGINNPYDFCFDAAGNMYISDELGHKIRKVSSTTGIITTIAGTGTSGYSGDGTAATGAMITNPLSICLDHSGNLIFSDCENNRIRCINLSTGIISTVSGDGLAIDEGDGGPATAARLNHPEALFCDTLGRIYIGCEFYRVRRIDNGGTTGVMTEQPFISSLYPNPSTGTFHVTFPGAALRDLVITDVAGREIWHSRCNEKEITLDLNNQPDGFYQLKVANGNKVNSQKIVVKH